MTQSKSKVREMDDRQMSEEKVRGLLAFSVVVGLKQSIRPMEE